MVKLNIYITKITNLTLLIKLMEDDPDSYSELQLEEVKIKIKQVEALIVELQASMQTTSNVLLTIREQVTLSEPLIKVGLTTYSFCTSLSLIVFKIPVPTPTFSTVTSPVDFKLHPQTNLHGNMVNLATTLAPNQH